MWNACGPRLRDLAIVVGSGQPVCGHSRIVAGVNDVVHHAGIVGIFYEERREHCHRSVLLGKACVVRRLGCEQRQRIEGARVHIVGVVSVQPAHRQRVSRNADRIILGAGKIEVGECGNISLFAFGARSQRLRLLSASGRSQISWKIPIATPQCAIAQPGSLLASQSNWARASAYQKSRSNATPRLKGACDGVAQETGNDTVPSRSFGATEAEPIDEWFIVWAATGRAASRNTRDVFHRGNYRGQANPGVNLYEFPRLSLIPKTRIKTAIFALTSRSRVSMSDSTVTNFIGCHGLSAPLSASPSVDHFRDKREWKE